MTTARPVVTFPSGMSAQGKVAIVGGGLAGLCAARVLNKAGIDCTIFEAADEVGGRVRTDPVKGFLLDRGFQVYLTAYPEGRDVLFYESLGLRPFEPGALVRIGRKFAPVFDPLRRPGKLLATAVSPVGTLGDKLRIARLRRELLRMDETEVWSRPEKPTLEALRECGFSQRVIDRFFRAFYGGVFLDRSLQTSRRMFDFTFRLFATGYAAVPEAGMEAIPRHILARLRERTDVRLNTKVVRADENGVTLAGGQRIMAPAVIVATDATSAAQLLGEPATRAWAGTTCLYFSAAKAPIDGAVLVLDGEGRGPVNHLAVMSNVSRSYAPPGLHLVSASVVGQQTLSETGLVSAVRAQMVEWFGADASTWEHLRTYSIPQSLPDQSSPALAEPARAVRVRRGLYVCGDHVDQASINGAMTSGRRAAEAVLDDLSG
jgi:phytoene dehydrogenase-like protein